MEWMDYTMRTNKGSAPKMRAFVQLDTKVDLKREKLEGVNYLTATLLNHTGTPATLCCCLDKADCQWLLSQFYQHDDLVKP